MGKPHDPPESGGFLRFSGMTPLGALRDLQGLWLRVQCACGRTTDRPIKMLARDHGGDALLQDLVPRLRCGRCRERPVSASLIESPQDGAKGYATRF